MRTGLGAGFRALQFHRRGQGYVTSQIANSVAHATITHSLAKYCVGLFRERIQSQNGDLQNLGVPCVVVSNDPSMLRF